MKDEKEIKKEHLDLLWYVVFEKYKKGQINNRRMQGIEMLLNHIAFMHLLIGNWCDKNWCKKLFWKVYDNEVGNFVYIYDKELNKKVKHKITESNITNTLTGETRTLREFTKELRDKVESELSH